MPTLRVQIDPLDPLLFGDSRSARAGEDHAQLDQDPSPATLFGGVGGRIAAAVGARGERHWGPAKPVLGPFVSRLEDGSEAKRAGLLGYALHAADGTLWFPKPLHVRIERHGGRLQVGSPVVPAGGGEEVWSSSWTPRRLTPEEPVPEHRLQAEVEEAVLVGERLLRSALTRELEGAPAEMCASEDLYLPDGRLGLAMDNRLNTAVPGRLFSRPYRRFAGAVRPEGPASSGFTAWYSVLSTGKDGCAAWDGVGFLGGDRRRAAFRFTEEDPALERLRSAVVERATESAGFLVYLVTPAVATGGPVEVAGRQAIAAAIGRPRTISGWSAAASSPGPRPIRTLIPEGSVFFFEWNDDESRHHREELLRRLWLGALHPRFAAAGFGRTLVGTW